MFKRYRDENGILTDFYVSRQGLVVKEFYKHAGQIYGGKIKPYKVRGYLTIRDWRENSTKKAYSLHRVVASCWLDEDLDSTKHVIFLDNNKENVSVDNLMIVGREDVVGYYRDICEPYNSWTV